MMYEMKIEKIKEEMMKEIAEKIQEHKQNCYDDLE